MVEYQQILGKWVFQILLDHFKDQSNDGTNKLFIKITGLSESKVKSLLEVLVENETDLEKYYNPIIRTIKPVVGHDNYKLQTQETSTWLRNYTFSGNALIMIINELTPEAQSLENLFAIDEAYLLSDFGMSKLYSVLADHYNLVSAEIETIIDFFKMYSKLTEPQLRYVLTFIEKLINEESPSIISSIQNNLPELNLFKDKELLIGSKGTKRLNSNYLLANLRKPNGDLDTEKLLNNLYEYLEKEEINNYTDEIWETVKPEELKTDVINFLSGNNYNLLTYQFKLVEAVLNFRTKSTLSEKIRECLIYQESPSDKESEKIEEGILEIEKNQNPELMQEFLEEYEESLSRYSKLDKLIARRIEKLLHPKDYTDLIDALQYELFSLIDEHEEKINSEITFTLSVQAQRLSKQTKEYLRIYLSDISNVVEYISFDADSLDDISDDESSSIEPTFKLSLIKDGKILGYESFKINGFDKINTLQFKDAVECNKIPHLKNYQEEEIEILDVKTLVEDRVKGYLTLNQKNFKEHYENFYSFLVGYSNTLKNIFSMGVFNVDIESLKEELDDLLVGVTESVDIASHVYRFVNLIGAIDTLNIKFGESGYSEERILTILNPIRLISYMTRYQKLNEQIADWIISTENNLLEVSHVESYLEFIREQTLCLQPRYFASDGDDTFLIETNEVLGEGYFILNTKRSENMDYLSKELSDELVKTVTNYLEVYPYAKDGLDILFLYCQSADIITKSIDSLFNKFKYLKKLKISVHSTQAAVIHQKVNHWIKLKEEYTNPSKNSKFPSVEVRVIYGNDINEIKSNMTTNMIDADLVVLADYFGQSNQIKYEFDRIEIRESEDWFGKIYKEPLLMTESMKRLSYVSEELPNILRFFYQLQYISQKKEILSYDEVYVLKNKIALTNFTDNNLIDFMHDNFNWIMFMDRYLDKSLLEKASSKAQIIQYKSKAGANKNFKLIVSSSEYIKKLNSKQRDYEYYDRLTRKLALILKNDNIQKNVIKEAVNIVKGVSGALILKAIGPGKFSHELIATFLSIERRSKQRDTLQVWSVCDELPWFKKNKRRPDLVITTISEENGKINLNFELLELKFVNRAIFDRERYDAIKQVQSGKILYEDLFDFKKNRADAEYWRGELIHYFVEKGTYSPEEVHLLNILEKSKLENIEVSISSSIDSYCYTSNLYDQNYEIFSDNLYLDKLEGEYNNFIYNRAYILDKLGTNEVKEPRYEELEEHNSEERNFIEAHFSKNDMSKKDDNEEEPEVQQILSTEIRNNINNSEVMDVPRNDNLFTVDSKEDYNFKEEKLGIIDQCRDSIPKNEVDRMSKNVGTSHYPEIKALENTTIEYLIDGEDHTELKKKYVTKLETKFNSNGLNVKVEKVIVGSSVVRLTLNLPSSFNSEKVMKRKNDIQLWLEQDLKPNIFIDKNGLNIDIVRDNPDTIYFEQFMEILREQMGDLSKSTKLYAPLGVDPLNNIISIDLSDPSTPHLLTGGTTGSGKSVTLNSIILGMMCCYKPEQLKFIFIDPKQVEFSIYEDLPHTEEVVTEIDAAVQTLNALILEMEKRYKVFKNEFASNLEEYKETSGLEMPRIVCVFDEFADFMSQDKETAKNVENAVLRLGQKARAAGIHLIICTQNPKSDIIDTNIRNNLGARLALRATDATASTIILGDSGAENLGGKGDFLAKTASPKVVRGKSPYLTPLVKKSILKFFRAINKA